MREVHCPTDLEMANSMLLCSENCMWAEEDVSERRQAARLREAGQAHGNEDQEYVEPGVLGYIQSRLAPSRRFSHGDLYRQQRQRCSHDHSCISCPRLADGSMTPENSLV